MAPATRRFPLLSRLPRINVGVGRGCAEGVVLRVCAVKTPRIVSNPTSGLKPVNLTKTQPPCESHSFSKEPPRALNKPPRLSRVSPAINRSRPPSLNGSALTTNLFSSEACMEGSVCTPSRLQGRMAIDEMTPSRQRAAKGTVRSRRPPRTPDVARGAAANSRRSGGYLCRARLLTRSPHPLAHCRTTASSPRAPA